MNSATVRIIYATMCRMKRFYSVSSSVTQYSRSLHDARLEKMK